MKIATHSVHGIKFTKNIFVIVSFAISAILLFTLVGNLNVEKVKADPSLPAGILSSIPIILTNSQAVATSAPFQQMITINSATYASQEAANLQNVEFYDSTGSVIPSWLESGNSNSATNSIYWLKLANGIPANSSIPVYLGFAGTTTNLFNAQSVGEAPQLSPTYGEYDTGGIVFNYYDNFASSLSGWSSSTGVTAIVNNGLTVNFPGNGYEVGPTENSGTAFDADITANPQEINTGYIATNSQTNTNYLGGVSWPATVIRESCNNTYPDQLDANAEANPCGGTSGSIVPGSETTDGVYSVVPISGSSSYQYVNYSTGSSTQPITKNAPPYPGSVGFALMNGASTANGLKVQWARVRAAPPNGIMPVENVAGAVAPTITTLTSSVNPTLSGQSVTFTANVTPIPDGGNIQFQDNGSNLGGLITLNSSGQAAYTTAALAVGSHNITANYYGDTNYAASIGNVTQVVNPAIPPSIALSVASQNGLWVSINATTNSNDPGAVITSIVWDWGDGQTIIGGFTQTHTYSHGSGYTVKATVTDSYGQSAQTSLPVAVSGSATQTATALASSLNPSPYQTQVMFTATVTPNPGSGTVQFQMDNSSNTTTLPVNGNGQAIFTTNTLSIGSHTVTACYIGDTTNASSVGSVSQVVNTAPWINFGVTGTVGLAVSINGGTLPNAPGTVITGVTWNWGDGQTMAGWMLETHTYSQAGTYTITATAHQSDEQNTSVSISVTVSGSATPTTISLTSSINPSVVGQSVTLTANVTPVPDSAGTVVFQIDGGYYISPAINVDSNGLAVFTDANLAAGSHSILAVFSGDAAYASSTCAITQGVNTTTSPMINIWNTGTSGLSVSINGVTLPTVPGAIIKGVVWDWGDNSPTMAGWMLETHTYSQSGTYTIKATATDSNGNSQSDSILVQVSGSAAPTAVTLSSSSPNNTSIYGQSVTFTATINPKPDSGTVLFQDNNTCNFAPIPVDINGQAIFTIYAPSVGANNIGAFYSGDATFSSSSSSVTQTVTATIAPTVNLFTPNISGLSAYINGVTLPTVAGAVITGIVWNWGDNSPAMTGWFPEAHTYNQNGTYTITVTSTDSNGQSQSASTTVTVNGTTMPTINPVSVGDTSVSGTAVPSATIVLTVNGTALNPAKADPTTGTWTVSLQNPLSIGDVISVTAQAAGQLVSAPAILTVLPPLNPAADLTNLVVTSSHSNPSTTFSTTTYNYNYTVADYFVSITPSWNQSNATVTIKNNATNGNSTINTSGSLVNLILNPGPNILNVTVTVPNIGQEIYSVVVTRILGPITNIVVTPGPSTSGLAAGATQQFKATVYYQDSTSVDLTNSVDWVSDNLTVATINSSGLATCGTANGTAYITASLSGVFSPAVGLTVGPSVVSTTTASIPNRTQSLANGGGTNSNGQVSDYIVGVQSDGTVTAAGTDINGDTDVSSWKNIVQVACGNEFTIGLKSDGTVVATGLNNWGECDVASWTNIIQVATGNNFVVGLKSDGMVVAAGWNNYGQCNVDAWNNIVQISAFGGYTLGLEFDGTVVATGLNNYGQCNVYNWTGITQVVAGSAFAVGLESNGKVVSAGISGQYDVSSWAGITQVAAGNGMVMGLESNGSVVFTGLGPYQQSSSWTGIIQLQGGYDAALGLKSDGTVVAAGSNPDATGVVGWNLGCGTIMQIQGDGGSASLPNGVTVIITKANSQTSVEIQSKNEGNTPPESGADVSLVGSQQQPNYYDISAIAGPNFGSNATAKIIIRNSAVGPDSTIQYYSGGTWNTADHISIDTSTSPPSISGDDIPVSCLTGTPFAIGVPTLASTSTSGVSATTTYSTSNQTVILTANVSSNAGEVNEGTVTFTIMNGATVLGTAVTSGTISAGKVSANYVLPGATPAGSYTILTDYKGGTDFSSSSDKTASLAIVSASTKTMGVSTTVTYCGNNQAVSLNAAVSSPGGIVSEGNVTFTIEKGSVTVGSAITSGTINNGSTNVSYNLPGGIISGTYTILAVYSGSNDFGASSDNTANLVIKMANTTALGAGASAIYSGSNQTMNLSASISSNGGVVNEGTVTFTIQNGNTVFGKPVISGTVSGGNANANFTLPGGTPAGTYTILAAYSGGLRLQCSSDNSANLVVNKANTLITGVSTNANYSTNAVKVNLAAMVSSTAGLVNEGTVTFTIMNGTSVVGSAVTSGTISGGNANVVYTLPSGTAIGNYGIAATYNGGPDFNTSSNNAATLVVKKADQTFVVSFPNPSVSGSQVVFAALVVPSSSNPANLITFVNGQTSLEYRGSVNNNFR